LTVDGTKWPWFADRDGCYGTMYPDSRILSKRLDDSLITAGELLWRRDDE